MVILKCLKCMAISDCLLLNIRNFSVLKILYVIVNSGSTQENTSFIVDTTK